MKTLEIKRDGLVKEMETIFEQATKIEKRSMNPDENEKFERIKSEVKALNDTIKAERFLLENQKQSTAGKVERSESSTFNLEKVLRSFTSKGEIDKNDEEYMFEEAKKEGISLKRGQLYIPASVLIERAAQTTSNSSAQLKVNQGADLSFVPFPILYKQVGARVYENLDPGALDLVSLQNYSVSFGQENVTITDASLTPAKATLTPRAVNATASFSRELLNQSNPAIMNQIMSTFMTVIDAAIDKEMYKQLSGLTNSVSTGVTYANILTLEAATNAVPTAFISSFKGRNYLKSKIRQNAATDSKFIWDDNNTVAGYSAFASPQAPNALYVLGNFQDLAVGKWGGLVIIEDIYTNKRNGLVDYSVIQMADVKVVNSASFAITKNGMFI